MSIKDYEGGIITKNPTTPTGPFQDGVASGVWTMDQAAEYTKQGVWPIAGNVNPEQYVDGLFSTYVYEGNGTSQTITNNLDLAGKGGMIWTKERSPNSRNNFIGDSARDNFRNYLYSNLTNTESGLSASGNDISSVSSTGYTLGTNNYTFNNESGSSQVSWSFLKKPGFFDVVTYTGTGSATTISHNLGSVPGVMIIKRTSDTESWQVYHRDFATDEYAQLNSTAASTTVNGTLRWNNTRPTSSVFSIGTHNSVNGSGDTYVAYLFAHDDQRFGDNQDESIIKCGSFTQGTTASSPTGNVTVNLGFEPQWLLIKNTTSGSDWVIYDAMRGVTAPVGGASYPTSNRLRANTDDVENNTGQISINSTGFTAHGGASTASDVEIYIAIRRPMMTPTAATEVFAVDQGDTTSTPAFTSGFVTDFNFYRNVSSSSDFFTSSRLTGTKYLATNSTAAESSSSSFTWDFMDGFREGTLGTTFYAWMWKRATGFFDVVAYTGTGSARTVDHNLGVAPELMIIKRRDGVVHWAVYSAARTSAYTLALESTSAEFSGASYWNATEPTASVFTVNTHSSVNQSSGTYIAYLFATLAGISKVGSYTGTAANLDVDCGFTAGARFILIKRTDSTGDWHVYDSERGIVAGNDPYILLNSTAAEVTGTDYIDPLSSGFTVTSSAPAGLNASGGTYIFLAIA